MAGSKLRWGMFSMHIAVLAIASGGCMHREVAGVDERGGLVTAKILWPQADPVAAAEFAKAIPPVVPMYEQVAERISEQTKEFDDRRLQRNEAFVIKSAVAIDGYVSVEYQHRVTMSAGTERLSPVQRRAFVATPNWKEELAARAKDEPFSSLRRNGLFNRIDDGANTMLNVLVRDSQPEATAVWFNGIGNSWQYEADAMVAVATRRYACAIATDSALGSLAAERFVLRPEPNSDGLKAELSEDLARPFGSPWQRRAVNAEAAAREAAGEFEARLLRVTGGVEFLRAYLERETPILRQRPLVVVGCSGGVPAALAFASRHIDRVAAVVLIGGGADLASVYLDSELTDPSGRVRWLPDHPVSEQREQFISTWLDACTVDPFHTAAAIPADRVLVIQASMDRIVPTQTGDRLWERLGRPERWTFHGGHTLLFWRLNAYASDIAAWIDAKVKRFEEGPANAQAQPSPHK
ncbi:MAG: hypothetical protein K2Y21_16325 [Phycisphaerales bacterium]|nr:hypothetical protein [Phycisphaerales bacterium]